MPFSKQAFQPQIETRSSMIGRIYAEPVLTRSERG